MALGFSAGAGSQDMVALESFASHGSCDNVPSL
jgi:hypothetical protein